MASQYQVYALCVGEKATMRGQFLYRDVSPAACTIAFYFWLILGPSGPIIIDCSFDRAEADRRGVTAYRDRTDLLGACGVAPADVRHVFVTHLHYDHWAGYDLFSNAIYFVQSREVEFWLGPGSRHALFRGSASMPSIAALQPLQGDGRIKIVHGNWNLGPGLRATLFPGHTPGLQTLTVEDDVMIASDTFHFYENLQTCTPVQVTVNMADALDTLAALAELDCVQQGRALPGHDPDVLLRFPALAPGVVRIC